MEPISAKALGILRYIRSLSGTKKLGLAILVFVILRKIVRALQSGKPLTDEIAFVTGGGSGIGRQLSIYLAQQGCKVVVADINFDAAEAVAHSIKGSGRNAQAVHCDVTDPASVREAANQARMHYGPPTILVNNAGIVVGKSLLETSLEQSNRVIKVNLFSHFITLHEFLPDMIAHKKGHIVSVASGAGHFGIAGMVDYCASKYGAVGLDEALRAELRMSGHSYIKTTCICPYFVDTEMFTGVNLKYQWILPRLKESWMAQRIIRAIRMEEEVVLVPYLSKFMLYTRYFWTPSQGFRFGKLFGLHNTMSTFHGRPTDALTQ